VAAEIVDDDDVTGPEGRDENLLDIGQEAVAVDRSVDDTGGIDPGMAPDVLPRRDDPARWRTAFFLKLMPAS